MEQKAVIVSDAANGKLELDDLLKDGWKVVHTCPMPSSASVGGESSGRLYQNPTCLVIVEKD